MNFKQLLILHYKLPLSLNDNFLKWHTAYLKVDLKQQENSEAGSIKARAHGDTQPKRYISLSWNT